MTLQEATKKIIAAAKPGNDEYGRVVIIRNSDFDAFTRAYYATIFPDSAADAVSLKEHTQHVQQFLNDLWAFSIDPLHEGMTGLKVADVCAALLKAAKDNRDTVYELEGLFRTACLWVWKGLDFPGQTLESTMEAMRIEYKKTMEETCPEK